MAVPDWTCELIISMTLPMRNGTDMVTAEETAKRPTAAVIAAFSGSTRRNNRHVSSLNNPGGDLEGSEAEVEAEEGASMGTEPL